MSDQVHPLLNCAILAARQAASCGLLTRPHVQRDQSMLTFESASVLGVNPIVEKLTVSLNAAPPRLDADQPRRTLKKGTY